MPDDGEKSEFGKLLDEWAEEDRKRARETEHDWLVETVKELRNENSRIKREIARRDRLILRHALDGKFSLTDLYPIAITAYLMWYFRESWWQLALASMAGSVCASLYYGRYIEPQKIAEREAIFKEMEGKWAGDY